jgi:excisionase family DNA binding protein
MLSLDIISDMPTDDIPLYVRLPADQAQRLDDMAGATGQSKRRLVEDAVRHHLGDEKGLVVGRAALRDDIPEVLTLPEAAAMLRVDDAALRTMAEAGELPGRAIGDEWRFSQSALLAWLAAGTAHDTPAPTPSRG